MRVKAGIVAAHNAVNARTFWAGSWTHQWALSHPAAMASGWSAALSLGARPDPDDYFMTSPRYEDFKGWETDLRRTGGRWPAEVIGLAGS